MPSLETDNSSGQTPAERLNQHCVCVTLDRPAIVRNLPHQLNDRADETLSSALWHQLFSDTAVFVPGFDFARMQAMVHALETAAKLPGYQEQVLCWAPPTASVNRGPIGAFMGYDFHLGNDGPRHIEINTNAGGAFLNAVVARVHIPHESMV